MTRFSRDSGGTAHILNGLTKLSGRKLLHQTRCSRWIEAKAILSYASDRVCVHCAPSAMFSNFRLRAHSGKEQ